MTPIMGFKRTGSFFVMLFALMKEKESLAYAGKGIESKSWINGLIGFLMIAAPLFTHKFSMC